MKAEPFIRHDLGFKLHEQVAERKVQNNIMRGMKHPPAYFLPGSGYESEFLLQLKENSFRISIERVNKQLQLFTFLRGVHVFKRL